MPRSLVVLMVLFGHSAQTWSTSFLRSDIKSSGMFFVAFVSVPLLICLSGFENKWCISWYAQHQLREKISKTNFWSFRKKILVFQLFGSSMPIDVASISIEDRFEHLDLSHRWLMQVSVIGSWALEMGFGLAGWNHQVRSLIRKNHAAGDN